MPSFEYTAIDIGGRARRGVVNAESARLARRELRRLELTPVKLSAPREEAAAATGIGGRNLRRAARVSPQDLVSVTRQLAVLAGAATPVEEALNAVALQTERPESRARLLAVRERVLEGWRLADAMGEDQKSFPAVYRAVVAAGESSGDMKGALNRLATMLEKNRAMRMKAITALAYPAAIFMVACGVVTALMTQVVPRIVEQFDTFEAELPLITRLVVGASNFIGDFGILTLVALILAGAAGWRILQAPKPRLAFDRWILSVPLVGKLLRALDGARFARTLATLYAGGAPLLESMIGAQRAAGNAHVRDRLDLSIALVREGSGLAAAMKRADVLPPMMVHMTAAGERAGAVPELLDKAALQLEEEFDTATAIALRLLEPAIIVALGGAVVTIVLAIILPMLQINSLASGQ